MSLKKIITNHNKTIIKLKEDFISDLNNYFDSIINTHDIDFYKRSYIKLFFNKINSNMDLLKSSFLSEDYFNIIGSNRSIVVDYFKSKHNIVINCNFYISTSTDENKPGYVIEYGDNLKVLLFIDDKEMQNIIKYIEKIISLT